MPSEAEAKIIEETPPLCAKGTVPRMKAMTDTPPVTRTAGPGASEVQPAVSSSGFYYAGEFYRKGGIGQLYRTWISEPTVPQLGFHSLDQLSEQKEPVGVKYTVELGWTVAPVLDKGNLPNAPHLFTYVNKDNYTSNGEPGGDCYNCEFVPIGEPKVL